MRESRDKQNLNIKCGKALAAEDEVIALIEQYVDDDEAQFEIRESFNRAMIARVDAVMEKMKVDREREVLERLE